MRERQKLDTAMSAVRQVQNELADAVGLIEMAEAENDAAMIRDAEAAIVALQKRAEQLRLQSMLSGEAAVQTAAASAGTFVRMPLVNCHTSPWPGMTIVAFMITVSCWASITPMICWNTRLDGLSACRTMSSSLVAGTNAPDILASTPMTARPSSYWGTLNASSVA